MIVESRKSETNHVQTTGIETQFKDLQIQSSDMKPNTIPASAVIGLAIYIRINHLQLRMLSVTFVCCSKQRTPTSAINPNQRNSQRSRKPVSKPKPSPKRPFHACVIHVQDSSSSADSSDDGYLYAVKNNNGDPRTKVTLHINTVPTRSIIDFDATTYFIESSTYDRLKDKIDDYAKDGGPGVV